MKQTLIDLLYKHHESELTPKEIHKLIMKLDDLQFKLKAEYWERVGK